jgi:hypothetical protein
MIGRVGEDPHLNVAAPRQVLGKLARHAAGTRRSVYISQMHQREQLHGGRAHLAGRSGARRP